MRWTVGWVTRLFFRSDAVVPKPLRLPLSGHTLGPLAEATAKAKVRPKQKAILPAEVASSPAFERPGTAESKKVKSADSRSRNRRLSTRRRSTLHT